MAQTPTLEVPVTPKLTIPFHEGETIRIEMERYTLIDQKPVRPRDCVISADGERLLGVQAVVVLDKSEDQRIIGVVFKAVDEKADEAITTLRTEPETTRHDIELVLGDSETGAPLRTFKITDARVLAHDLLDSGAWLWLDFIGTPAE